MALVFSNIGPAFPFFAETFCVPSFKICFIVSELTGPKIMVKNMTILTRNVLTKTAYFHKQTASSQLVCRKIIKVNLLNILINVATPQRHYTVNYYIIKQS